MYVIHSGIHHTVCAHLPPNAFDSSSSSFQALPPHIFQDVRWLQVTRRHVSVYFRCSLGPTLWKGRAVSKRIFFKGRWKSKYFWWWYFPPSVLHKDVWVVHLLLREPLTRKQLSWQPDPSSHCSGESKTVEVGMVTLLILVCVFSDQTESHCAFPSL